MMLLGGFVGLLMLFGIVAGVALVGLGIYISAWAYVYLGGFALLGIWQWRSAKRAVARRAMIPPRVMIIEQEIPKQPRGPRANRSWNDDPNLPSSLD